MPIESGQMAPEFTLPDAGGETHSLADYRGKPLVLYFYPKDDTPGCTKEACNFRDDYSAFTGQDVNLVGVSPDDPKSHRKFADKYDLPFSLLADDGHQVCELYGVWGEKSMFGKKFHGVLRTTFLIDAQGKIAKVFYPVQVTSHSKEVLEALDEIRPN